MENVIYDKETSFIMQNFVEQTKGIKYDADGKKIISLIKDLLPEGLVLKITTSGYEGKLTTVLFVEDSNIKQQYPVSLYKGPYLLDVVSINSGSWFGLAKCISYELDGISQFCYFDSDNIQHIFTMNFVEKKLNFIK